MRKAILLPLAVALTGCISMEDARIACANRGLTNQNAIDDCAQAMRNAQGNDNIMSLIGLGAVGVAASQMPTTRPRTGATLYQQSTRNGQATCTYMGSQGQFTLIALNGYCPQTY